MKNKDISNVNNLIDDYKRDLEQKEKLVSSKEYLDWLVSHILECPKHTLYDDMYLYDNNASDINKENVLKLSWLHSYIAKIAKDKGIKEIVYDNEFPMIGCYFYYNFSYFEIATTIGQGSYTTITLCHKEPQIFVSLDDKQMELIQYIIVNQDLDMSRGKIAAQVGHACTMCAVNEHDNSLFKQWYLGDQKKIILRGHQKDLEKLLNKEYYEVRDNGLTEIPANSLTVISLGVKSKDSVKAIVKRFQLL